MEDFFVLILFRDYFFDNNKFWCEFKLECIDVVDMEDYVDCKERKKRKREEVFLIEVKKGRVKVKEEVVVIGVLVVVEFVVFDVVVCEVMELDQKVVENEVGDRGNFENDSIEKEGLYGNLELVLIVKEGDGQMEVNYDEEWDFVKVEVFFILFVYFEELNIGKFVSIVQIFYGLLFIFCCLQMINVVV